MGLKVFSFRFISGIESSANTFESHYKLAATNPDT